MIGIYAIRNTMNEKMYIGESINVINRWNTHKKDLTNNQHHSFKLQQDWNKYGEDNFKFTILELFDFNANTVIDRKKLKISLLCREFYYIKKHQSIKNGYNIENTLLCVCQQTLKDKQMLTYLGNDIKDIIKSNKYLFNDSCTFQDICDFVVSDNNLDNPDVIVIPQKRVSRDNQLLLISRINKFIQAKLNIKFTNHQLKDLFVDLGYLNKISNKIYSITDKGLKSNYLQQGNITINGYEKNKILLTPLGQEFVIEYVSTLYSPTDIAVD